MRTFKCNGCYERCCVTIQFGSNPPCRCHHDDNPSNWQEVKEEQKLPKLTTEVFDHPACPTWANYASVNKNGRVIFYEDKKSPGKKGDIGFFDASDWENSLVERPIKALPDWVKVERYGFDNVQKRYFEIIYIDKKWVDIEYLDDGNGETVCRSDMHKCCEAVKRPFNDKEMKALVGKVLEWEGNLELVNSYDANTAEVYADHMWCGAEYLMGNEYTIDGKPCVIYEHLEDGVWIQ